MGRTETKSILVDSSERSNASSSTKQVSFRLLPSPKDDAGNTIIKSTRSSNSERNGGNIHNQTVPNLSESSWESSGGSSTSSASVTTMPSLGERLLRTQKHRDPMRYYEVTKLLGDGSMGSVSLVRKRTFGGSARQSFVQDEQLAHAQNQWCWPSCFSLFCPPNSNSNKNEKNAFVDVKDSKGSSSNGNPTTTTITTLSSTTAGTTVADSSSSNSMRGSMDPTDDGAATKNHNSSSKQRQRLYRKSSSSLISFGTQVSVDFALKTIILDQCENDTFRQELLHEIAILRGLDHPNIVRALESYDYHRKLYLVLELCHGGDLYSRDPYTENQARSITYSLLDAIAYLHSKSITHRDLKYENVMFASPSSSTVKIIDFGLSKKYGKDNSKTMSDTVGTVYTMAPEVLRGHYDEKCDVWSMGVIAFMLVSSCMPFYGETRRDVVKKILKADWNKFKYRPWKKKSPLVKDLIASLLLPEAAERPSATQAMEHEWFQLMKKGHDQQADDDNTAPLITTSVVDRVQATMQVFTGYPRLKKLALMVIAYQSIDEEIGFLRRLFLQRFDTDKADANVSYAEFKTALQMYNYSDEEVSAMFSGINIDGSGKVSFTEFLAASIEAHGMIEEERIAEAFDRIDCDDTGYITANNLKDILGNKVDKDFINGIIKEAKQTPDNDDYGGCHGEPTISYEEFLGLWDRDGDERLRQTLVEVQQRRMGYEKAISRQQGSTSRIDSVDNNDDVTNKMDKHATFSTSEGSSEHDTSIATDSIDDVSRGKSSFDKEKIKSLRGVWILQ